MARFALLSNLSAALVLIVSSCFAESINLRSPVTHAALQQRKVTIPVRHNDDPYGQYRFLPPLRSTLGDTEEDLELLDICLVASVDGKFHALNRTSGQILWSTTSTPSSDAPAALAPLVRTQHIDPDESFDDTEHKELYIIEPQSGNIFILPSPNAPLQRLPFSVPQLVDMSPFSFSGDEEHRVFVGKKETSLLSLELETGRLKGIVNSECPWDPFADIQSDQSLADLDLDELDGTKETPISTEVLIGRTDYHVSIHTRPSNPSLPKPPVQELIFSIYGPNNQDHAIQSAYRRTPDDIYIQPTPGGDIMSFKTALSKSNDEWSSSAGSSPQSRPIWGHTFKNPVVAVFDILRSPSRQHPLALLQPQPRLYDVLPNVKPNFDNPDAPFIGLVEDNGSLFAMTPENFPLVVFHPLTSTGEMMARGTKRRTIDAPPGEGLENHLDGDEAGMGDVDFVNACEGGKWDRRCVIGRRPIEASDHSRLRRLLPDPESVKQSAAAAAARQARSSPVHGHGHGLVTDGNNSGGFDEELVSSDRRADDERLGVKSERKVKTTAAGALTALLVFLVGLWYLTKGSWSGEARDGGVSADNVSSAVDGEAHVNGKAEVKSAADINVIDFANLHPDHHPPASPTSPRVTFSTGVANKTNYDKDGTDPIGNAEAGEDGEGDEEPEPEPENQTPGKKKGTRRKGRGRKGKGLRNLTGSGIDEKAEMAADAPANNGNGQSPTLVLNSSSQPSNLPPQLVVSDEVLGFGSHGTVVYRGSLQGRAVAVKRLLQDFVTLAEREVNILQESDDHPNVIRYYYQEAQANFLFIALELCPASLADVIERPDLHRDISNGFVPKRALVQVTSGLRHLHSLKIIHRDIKPQNILISAARKGGTGVYAGHRMLISDFGLCRKLDADQTSFAPTAYGAHAAGTIGWRAPEILRGEVKIDESAVEDVSQSSRSSVGTATNGSVPGRGGDRPARLTKSVDIFALGCLYFYTLTSGEHPYGDRYEREANIFKDEKKLTPLEDLGEEGLEAIKLIGKMLDAEASKRPDTEACLIHPFFWDPARRLAFLQDASDRFEIMCRDPREPNLVELEKDAFDVVGNDWQARLDRTFLDNLGKYRKYDGKSVQDLMRALRNKKHHYQDLPDNVKRTLGPLPEGFLLYFTKRFPHLFMHVYDVVSRTSLRYEPMFRSYFELSD